MPRRPVLGLLPVLDLGAHGAPTQSPEPPRCHLVRRHRLRPPRRMSSPSSYPTPAAPSPTNPRELRRPSPPFSFDPHRRRPPVPRRCRARTCSGQARHPPTSPCLRTPLPSPHQRCGLAGPRARASHCCSCRGLAPHASPSARPHSGSASCCCCVGFRLPCRRSVSLSPSPPPAWPVYCVAQDTMFWPLFVLRHNWCACELAISLSVDGCCRSGLVSFQQRQTEQRQQTHPPLLRISHWTHHQNHGHIEKDESWYPVRGLHRFQICGCSLCSCS